MFLNAADARSTRANQGRISLFGTAALGFALLGGSLVGAAAQTLEGYVVMAPAAVSLTDEGATDWIHWGLTGDGTANNYSTDRKASGGSIIGAVSTVGGNAIIQAGNFNTLASWIDGAPTASAANTPTAIQTRGFYGNSDALRFSVPASTTKQALHVYCGVENSDATMTARLLDTDGTTVVTTYTSQVAGQGYGQKDFVYTFYFQGAAAGQTLELTWVTRDGNIGIYSADTAARLQGATLAPIAAPLAVATGYAPASADFTAQGTTDWIQWGLTSGGDNQWSVNRKAAGGSRISDFVTVGGGTVTQANLATAVSWTDGDPTTAVTGTTTGVAAGDTYLENNGVKFTVNAGAGTNTLHVYCGVENSNGTMTARLLDTDGTTEIATDTRTVAGVSYNRLDLDFNFIFEAAQPGQTLEVTWRNSGGRLGQYSSVATRLQGATLSVTSPAVSAVTVTGTLALDGVSDLSAVNPAVPVGDITFDFFAAGAATHTAPLFTKTAPISSTGAFSLSGVTAGSYDIGISSSKSLRTVVKNVNANNNVTLPDTTTLLGGNANGDNTVNFDDFLVLLNAFGSDVSDTASGFDPAADFNYDGVVNFDDFLILLGNFGSTSDI